jgi:nucleolar protein 12
MAKSKDKQPAKPESRTKSDKTFTKIDKKAFDPALASLFASSVCELVSFSARGC